MEEILRQYFKWVFKEDFFTVALDRTGCYFFTDCLDDNTIGQQYSMALEDLSLQERQVVLCVVGRESAYSYCGLELLGQFVLKATQGRSLVLSDKDIASILACYGVEQKVSTVERRDWSQTELFKQLVGNEFDLSETQINEICRIRPRSVYQLRALGVPDQYAVAILKEVEASVQEESSMSIEVLSHQTVPSFTKDEVKKMVERQFTTGCIFLVVALACAVLAVPFVITILLAILSMIFFGKVRKREDSAVTTILLMMCLLLIASVAGYTAWTNQEVLLDIFDKITSGTLYDLTM